MHALQDLGVELVALDAKRLAALDLPEQPRRRDHARSASITRHEAKRRQMQYIGRLMRDIDAGAAARRARRLVAGTAASSATRFALLERWRDRMLAEPDGVAGVRRRVPDSAASTRSRAWSRDARDERARGAPPRKSRALFRELKRIVDVATRPTIAAAP